MTALSADRNLRFLGPVFTEKLPLTLDVYPISIWRGAGVIIDISVDDTSVTPADGVTMVTGDIYIGIAAEHAVSEQGQADPTMLEVYVWPTIVGFGGTGMDLSDVGKDVSLSDSGTLTASGGAYPVIGSVYTVRDGYTYVLLNQPTVK